MRSYCLRNVPFAKVMSVSMTALPAVLLDKNTDRKGVLLRRYFLEVRRHSVRLPHDLTIRERNLPTRNNKTSARHTPTKTTNLHAHPPSVMSFWVQAKTTRCVAATFIMDTVDGSVWREPTWSESCGSANSLNLTGCGTNRAGSGSSSLHVFLLRNPASVNHTAIHFIRTVAEWTMDTKFCVISFKGVIWLSTV